MDEFRIRKYDSRNWVIEKFISSKLIKKGFNKGQYSKSKWIIEGYYGKLEHLVPSLLNMGLEEIPYKNTDEILKSIRKAEMNILSVLNEKYGEV